MNPNSYEIIDQYLNEVRDTLTRIPIEKVVQVVDILNEARQKGRRIFTFGNGGSAATASHFAADLAKGAISSTSPRLKAFALTDNVPLISAWANDSAYENIFAEQLENFIEAEDVAIGISGSGNSVNVLKGVMKAKAKGATTVGLIGFEGGKLVELVDVAVVVPSDSMEQVEDIHLLLEHAITTCLRELQ